MPLPYSGMPAAGDRLRGLTGVAGWGSGSLGGGPQSLRFDGVPYEPMMGIRPDNSETRSNALSSTALASAIPELQDRLLGDRGHSGPLQSLMSFSNSGSLAMGDETGNVQVGPNGLSVTRNSADKRPDWSLSVNPRAKSAEFSRGGLTVSGSWNPVNPSASIGYKSGGGHVMGGDPDVAAQGAMDQALRSYETRQQEYQPPSPQEELEMQLARRRAEDPRWYAP